MTVVLNIETGNNETLLMRYSPGSGVEILARPGDVFDGEELVRVVIRNGNFSRFGPLLPEAYESVANANGDCLVLIVTNPDDPQIYLGAWIEPESVDLWASPNGWYFNDANIGWLNSQSPFHGGWTYSLQLGWVYMNNYPWIFDLEWGWLRFLERTSESGPVHFYLPEQGYVSIMDEAFIGWFYNWEAGTWGNFVSP
jgi:hypothetical protein